MKPKRHVPLVTGIVSVGLSLVLFFADLGWWRFLAGGFLLAYGWASIKTSLLASDKEIVEMTTDVPLSDETAKRFQDRI